MSDPARTSIKKRILPTGSPVSGGAPAGAWVVSLADVPLADVLKRIALEEKSGDLQVISRAIVKTIYFDQGFVVFASSNLEADRLGHRLIQTGHISRNEFAAAAKLTAGRNRRLGQALVDAGLMSEEELGHQVASQVNGIILSLFQLQDAIYSFDERPCAIPVELMVSLSIHRILLEGIRDMTCVELIQKGLPPLDNWVQIAERPPFTMDVDKLTSAEQAVHQAVGRGGALESILQKLSGDQLVLLRACYGLYASGIFEPVDPRDTWRPRRVQEETIAFRLSALEKNAAHVQAQNVRQEILMEFDRIKRIPDEEALGIYDEADAHQIERAYDERSRAWARKREVVEGEPSLASKVDTIQAYLKQAHDRFLSYVTSASNKGAPAAEPVIPDASQPNGDALASRKRERHARGHKKKSRARASSPERTAPADHRGTESSSAERKARECRIEQLLRDVKQHSRSRDWEGAVSLLFELVALAPDNAVYHGMLANAMSRHPVMRINAERHYIEALRIAPQNADLHHCLGLYYKSFGMNSRASAAFRTALCIAPDHRATQRLVFGERGTRKSLGARLRGLLGRS